MKVYTSPKLLIATLMVLVLLAACSESANLPVGDKLFTTMPASASGVDFQNVLVETESSNYYKYMYTYIGGGVAAADFNNDDLIDLFFTANTADNKLFLNKGNFQFEDITEAAGIEQRSGFDAGVTVADVNADGFLDIYVCRGGWIQENNQFANMLFINNGDLTFTEKAVEYGLADENRGIAATFFDYDRDGDLDVYLSNSPDFKDKASEVLDLTALQTDPATLLQKGSDKLYQNDGTGHFTDVSVAAGILPDLGFGLNPQVGDLNNDGWLDIYVCNDFRIPDFIYVNQKDGSFREARKELFKHLSFNSMGSDIADVNNDGLLDILTLDMNPEDYIRSKTTMAMTSLDMFETMIQQDYHYNYMHNMLQLNNGQGAYSEIAQLAGVSNTDWSWACLLADFDLDGYNDIYITNGVFRDVIDRDKNNEILQLLRENQRKPTDADFLTFTKMLPQQKLANYFFRNQGDLTFTDVSSSWTDSIPSFSNGATYADLDNDGDLDLVVNNINTPAMLLRNNAMDKAKGHFLQVNLLGSAANPRGVGASVQIRLESGMLLSRQLINSRGFLSAVSHRLHFGFDAAEKIETVNITWPDGKVQTITNPSSNQVLTLNYVEAVAPTPEEEAAEQELALFVKKPTSITHIDPPFNDYAKQILLPHKLSQTGPAAAKADVNQDGFEDIYIGGGHTQAGQLLLGSAQGTFRVKEIADFARDKQREDVGACFFDADNDGDYDLYVVSGSYEFNLRSKLLIDRLYVNDGRGNFTKTSGQLPEIGVAGSIVRPADFDQDGDIDLLVGGRVVPGQYPYAPPSYLLQNEGGNFTEVTSAIAPELVQIGLVTDAVWTDIDQDEDLDLIITGEWMGIEVFENERGEFSKSDEYAGLAEKVGWWNKISIADIDNDGDQDIVAGNLGLNSKFHASAAQPFHVYMNDFDYNGTADVILAKYYNDMEVPVRGKTCTTQQIPHLAKKIPTYNDFASKDLKGILGPGLKTALHYEATEFRSGIFTNDGNGQFSFTPFSTAVQQSPINSIIYHDFDGDQQADLLLAGNNYMPEVETTRADAGVGVFLKGNGGGQFEPYTHLESGFFANKDVRAMLLVEAATGPQVWVLNNNDKQDCFEVQASMVN